jgi:hypothetical protein
MNMNLFVPIVPYEKQHPNYRMITTPGYCQNEMELIQSWADGFIDRDGKFVREFQTTFNSSFWELYLHSCFKELGFVVDYSHASPDFVLSKGTNKIIAEATTASHPDGYTAEWERNVSEEALEKLDVEEILELASVRLASSFATKHKKYLENYAKLEHVRGLPFVLCLAPFEQPFFFTQNDNAINRVLYGFDQFIHFDMPESQSRIIFGQALFEKIVKASGTEIELGFFRDDRMKEVSAVIFSSCATFSKVRALSKPNDYPVHFFAKRYNDHGIQPFLISEDKTNYKESLLDGMHICLNPFADRPLMTELFESKEICIQTLDPESGELLFNVPHGFLIERVCMSGTPSEISEALKMRVPEGKPMMPHASPSWAEGELHSANAVVGPFSDNSLAHYQGWTILISHDMLDNDWGAQALSVKVKTVPQFIRLNRDSNAIHLMAPVFYPTKEKALEEMKKKILQYLKVK